MSTTRRRFLGIGAGFVCGSLAAADEEKERIRCLDYGRSFICHKGESAASNAVRFQVESRTLLLRITALELRQLAARVHQ